MNLHPVAHTVRLAAVVHILLAGALCPPVSPSLPAEMTAQL